MREGDAGRLSVRVKRPLAILRGTRSQMRGSRGAPLTNLVKFKLHAQGATVASDDAVGDWQEH